MRKLFYSTVQYREVLYREQQMHMNWPTRSLSYQLLIQRSEIKKEKHIEKPKKKKKREKERKCTIQNKSV